MELSMSKLPPVQLLHRKHGLQTPDTGEVRTIPGSAILTVMEERTLRLESGASSGSNVRQKIRRAMMFLLKNSGLQMLATGVPVAIPGQVISMAMERQT